MKIDSRKVSESTPAEAEEAAALDFFPPGAVPSLCLPFSLAFLAAAAESYMRESKTRVGSASDFDWIFYYKKGRGELERED